jgi:hypothetical protein
LKVEIFLGNFAESAGVKIDVNKFFKTNKKKANLKKLSSQDYNYFQKLSSNWNKWQHSDQFIQFKGK